MRALMKVAHGVGNVEIREIERPVLPAENWVLIKVRAAGICGTDVHVWQDKFMYWPPVTLGHEFSGEIVETGKDCLKFAAGDRVVAEPGIKMCGKCEYCRSGRWHMCAEKWTLGWRTNGSMAEYIAMPEDVLHRIPDTLSFEIAALCEPVAITIYDVAEHGKINCNDFVVVQGSGPIGILAAYVAKSLGARKVLLTGLDSSEYCRFAVAKTLGADYLVNIQKEDAHQKVMELTDGKGADCVIETSGAPSAIAGSVNMLKKGGRLIAVGIPGAAEILFPWKDAVLKSLEFYFNMSSSYTSWDKAIGMLDRDQHILKNMITWTGDLSEWDEIFHSLAAEKDIKAVFSFQ